MKTKQSHSQLELKQAYQIVQEDLFKKLLKTKDDESIQLTNLGKLTKKVRKQVCGWDKKTHLYYQVKFTMFSKLKQAFKKQTRRSQ